ncbi:MAG: divalent metal cation transporter [Desulfomonile tiedjei]|nr:divalent metal cation transporter [Desulfomonile tiedjei]
MTERADKPTAKPNIGFFKMRWRSLLAFLVLMGPGIITSNVDNDAGGIATYSLAGAGFGFSMLWTLIPITILLIIIQEMGARMAVVSGKGLSDLIRERYGVRLAFYTMILLILNNLGNCLAEFAGIAAALEIFGVSRYISVPVSILFLLWLVVKGSYESVEKWFLTACLFYLAYVVAGFLVQPEWTEVIASVAKPTVKFETSFLVMLVGLVGTTIAPWMMFYLQASMVDKGLGIKDLKAARTDVIAGSVVVNIVAFFIILACAATLFKAGIKIETAQDAALALRPLAGDYCTWLFAIGLLNASVFAASILPLSTAYTVCEAFGWESSLDQKFSQAPQFYGLYCFIVVFSALIILMPGIPLVPIMFISQVANGLVLPVVLVFMIFLTNDPTVMKGHTNGPVLNLISWIAVALLVGLSLCMIGFTLAGQATP